MRSAARHRLDLAAQAVERAAVDAREQPPVAPLESLAGADARRDEAPAQHAALQLDARERGLDVGRRAAPSGARERGRGGRARRAARCARTISTSAPSRVGPGRRAARGRLDDVRARSGASGQTARRQRAALGGDPERPASPVEARGAPRRDQRLEEIAAAARRARRLGQRAEVEQQIVQLVGVARVGLRPRRPPRRSPSGSSPPMRSATVGGQPAAHADRARAALLERRVVEEGVGVGVQDLVREHATARASRARRVGSRPSRDRARARARRPVGVHRLGQAVAHRLAHQRVVGDLDGAAAVVVLAGGLRGEDRGEQVVARACAGAAAARACRRGSAAAPASASRSSASASRTSAPAARPASAAPRRRSARSIAKTVSSGKLCCGPSESSDAVVGRRRLQLEVEADRQKRLRSAMPQARLMRPPKGAWMTSCMPPASSKKRSAMTRVCVGTPPERRARRPRRSRAAARRRARSSAHVAIEPRRRRPRRARRAARRSPRAAPPTSADSSRVRAGPSPSQNGIVGGAPARVLDAHLARSRRGGCATTVLPSRKTSPAIDSMAKSSSIVPIMRPVGLEHDVVVGVVGDGAAGGERGEPRAAPAAQPPVDGVAVERARPRARGGWRCPRTACRPPRRSRSRASVGVGRGAPARARRARPRPSPRRRRRRRSAGRGRRAARRAARRRRARRARAARTSAAHSTSWSRVSGKRRPLGVAPQRVAGAADALQRRSRSSAASR